MKVILHNSQIETPYVNEIKSMDAAVLQSEAVKKRRISRMLHKVI